MLYMLDVDGTLVEGFLRNWKKEGLPKQPAHHTDVEKEMYDAVTLLPGRRRQIEFLVDNDPHARFAIVTNQGGVAYGFQTVPQVIVKMSKVVAELYFFYSRPFSVHICFNHPNGTLEEWKVDDGRRKPQPGMLLEAMEAHGVTAAHTHAVMVGDMASDEEAAAAADVPYMDAEKFFS